MNTISNPDLPVVVICAGPFGLAAAAHLVERGLRPLVLERGESVGATLLDWGHVQVFSPWRYNIDEAARRLLEEAGWQEPEPEMMPTGAEVEPESRSEARREGEGVRITVRSRGTTRT